MHLDRAGYSRIGAFVFLTLFGIQIVRLALYEKYSIDEFTYAHGAWAISQGQEPFRDYFLHHFPFSLQLGSVVFNFLDDDPQNIFYLRVLIIPFLILSCFGAALLNRKHGLLAAWLAPIFLVAVHPYLKFAVQFRPDSIAAALFIGSLVLLHVNGPRPKARAFGAGIMLMAAIWASEKVLVYGAGYVIALLADLGLRNQPDRRPLLVKPSWFLSGVLSSLILIGLYLTYTHNWAGCWNWAIKWALVHERSYPGHSWLTYMDQVLGPTAWALAIGAIGFLRSTFEIARLRRGALNHPDILLLLAIVFSAASYVIQEAAYLYSLIPFFIFLSIFAAREAALWWAKILECRTHRWLLSAVAIIAIATILCIQFVNISLILAGPRGSNQRQREILGQLGELVASGRFVYDNAGNYVSRNHVHFMYFTDKLIRTQRSEFIAREMPMAIRSSGCTAFIRDLRFESVPESLKEFIRKNFQPYNAEISLWGRRFLPTLSSGVLHGSYEAVCTGEYFVEPSAAAPNIKVDGLEISRIFNLRKGVHQLDYNGSLPFYILWLPDNRRPYVPIVPSELQSGNFDVLYSGQF